MKAVADVKLLDVGYTVTRPNGKERSRDQGLCFSYRSRPKVLAFLIHHLGRARMRSQ